MNFIINRRPLLVRFHYSSIYCLVHFISPSNFSTKMSVELKNEKCDKIKPKIIWPPDKVKEMKILNKEMFKKKVQVPFVLTKTKSLFDLRDKLKDFFLKMPSFVPAQRFKEDEHKVYLDPDKRGHFPTKLIVDLKKSGLLLSLNDKTINYETIELNYDNFNHITLFRAILPDNIESLTGFSTIGHIIHLNLRDHHLPYKNLIGQILVDKIKSCRLVINKLNTIDTKYRNFEMEILAQDSSDPPPTTIVKATEWDIRYKFDFAKVYWNPRLNTERMRIISKLQKNVDTVYDVFAGVGPFAIAAAKIGKCQALANDLNPDSYYWLRDNVQFNKVKDLVECFNLDGRDFIRTKIRENLLEQIFYFDGTDINRKFHVIMNLPAIAIEFLNEFNGLLSSHQPKDNDFVIQQLHIHCYCFLKDIEENHEDHLIELVSTNLGHKITKEDVDEIINVRKVAPNKFMYRISFRLGREILYKKTETEAEEEEEEEVKKTRRRRRPRKFYFSNKTKRKKIKSV